MAADRRSRSEERDYYEVLGAQPSASAAQLRGAFRDAVLRHHPDRAPASEIATRRTSLLNRAWAELRDPVRRIHYDRTLERGHAATVDWPLEEGEAPSAPPRRRRRRPEPLEPSPWHQPQWRSVAGFRVPADVFLAGPAAQRRWIVDHHIRGEDWRAHGERYWLRFAARYYRDQGRTEDALGALERLVDLEPTFDGIVRADLRDAFAEAGQELRGASLLRRAGERFAPDGPQRQWAERELGALLGDFRERRVARGRPPARAENGELLLNFMESLGLEPSFSDVRAAIVAHRRAGNVARAAELVERVAAQPVTEAGRWFSLVQLLTEAGELDRASALLAEIARGDHPEALDARRINGQPWKRIAAARERLARARRRLRGRSAPVETAVEGRAVGA
jgi:curved DNA-binding protein CbpA